MLPKHRLWFRLLRTGPGRRNRRPPLPWPVWGQQAWGDAPFGRGTLAKNGCEALAARWALAFCGVDVPAGQVVTDYERHLLLWGHLGCDPFAPPRALEKYGLCCREFTDLSAFCACTRRDGVFLLTFWNGDRLFSGAHGVALCRRQGRLWVCNRHNGQTAPAQLTDVTQLTDDRRFIVGYQVTMQG